MGATFGRSALLLPEIFGSRGSSPTAINTIDAFEFSTQSVPDSDPFVLTGLGGTLFALYRRFAPKRCS